MDITSLLPSLLLFALAAAAQGFLGFGFGIVAMTTLAFHHELQHLAGVVNLTGLLVSALMLWQLRGSVLWPLTLRFVPGILLGVLLGVAALGTLPTALMLRALGAVTVALAAWNLTQTRLPRHSALWADTLAGFAGGLLGGAFNTGGPPLVAHLYRRPVSPDALRGSIQVLFLSISLARVPVAWGHGMWTERALLHALFALPFVAAGLLAGARLARRASAAQFRKSAWLALGFLGLVLLLG